MGIFLHLALAYVIGGLTFLPLLAVAVFAYVYYTSREIDPTGARNGEQGDDLHNSSDDKPDLSKLPPELQRPDRERDAAAGYFAISREYVAGGVNGKPPERLTPAGEVIAIESPSVYQTMYRSIFERNKAQGPSFESTGGGNVKATKKARNVFYVALRHGHLMLYDNADQLEPRHVISLGLYDIDVYGGGEEIPEGELWVRRNCIRLRRKDADYSLRDSKPYYFFSDNCSDKEDFYHALVQNQHRASTSGQAPLVPLKFEADHMVKLVQQLHGSEELMQTRWFNALLGRVFLSLYKTNEVHGFIHKKIMKKIARIQTPSFIEHIKVGRIDMGSAAPLFTNQKLRELTLDGELVLETDVRYSGGFRLEIAAQVLIDLGKRFNVRRIDILLSGLLKSLEGHLLIKIKPPPCNRTWISFETMPKLDLSIEPIVQSRQITYGIILRTIESKIREVMGETLVYPNWDDIPFSRTEGDPIRGGLWDFHAAGFKPPSPESSEPQKEEVDGAADTPPKSQSTPSLLRRRPVGGPANGKAKSTKSSMDNASLSSGHDSASTSSQPKPVRSSSFAASTSPPLVSMSPTHASAFKYESEGQNSLQDTASAMKGLSSRNSSTSTTPPNLDMELQDANTHDMIDDKESSQPEDQDVFDMEMPSSEEQPRRSSTHSRKNGSKSSFSIEGFGTPMLDEPSKKGKLLANAQFATAAARKWGADFVAKRATTLPTDHDSVNNSTSDLSATTSVQSMPVGRGQPLPPPGQPLPGPQKKNWATALGSIGRKKVPSQMPSVSSLSAEGRDAALKAAKQSVEALPPLPSRRSVETPSVPGTPTLSAHSRKGSQHSRKSGKISRASVDGVDARSGSDEVLVIKAPEAEGGELDGPEDNGADAHLSSEDKDVLRREDLAGEASKLETTSVSSISASDASPLQKDDEETPTRKQVSTNGRDQDISEDKDTKTADKDSLELLQTLVH